MMPWETKNWPRSTFNMRINCNALVQTLELPTLDHIVSRVGLLNPTMRSIFLTVIFGCGFCAHSIAELQPSEVAVIAARGNRDSEGLAGYYAAHVRSTAAKHLPRQCSEQ